MPSLLGHAVVGMTAVRLSPQSKRTRWFWVLTLFCSLIPDADVLLFAFGVEYESFLGHRGFSHSILFAFLMGYLAARLYEGNFFLNWKVKFLTPGWWKAGLWNSERKWKAERWNLVFYFFLVTLSHSLLDALTDGGHGVALFSPWVQHRYFYRMRPIYVSPLSFSSFFGLTGMRVIFREFIYIVIPCVILSSLAAWAKIKEKHRRRSYWPQVVLLGLLLSLGLPHCLMREELFPGINGVNVHKASVNFAREKKYGISHLPLEGLPDRQLIVNYLELNRRNLFNFPLVPRQLPWSGPFFPIWLGGVSGRWQESYLMRAWRGLMGDAPPLKSQVIEWLHASQDEVHEMAPTEKYDLAIGDYYMTSSRYESSERGRNSLKRLPQSPFWSGYCNGVALASIYEREPKHPVTVINPDGYEIRFYPDDIKALLAIAYISIEPDGWTLGNRCNLEGPRSEDCLDVAPADFVIALTNLIGLGKGSFLIDQDPFVGVQNAPIRKAEVKVINPPYFASERASYFEVDDILIQWLMDVEIQLTLAKITPLDPLDHPWPEVPIPLSVFPSQFKSNALSEQQVTYRATLGLDRMMNLVGGRWEDPFHHPDFAWGGQSVHTQPKLKEGFTVANLRVEWAILRALVERSSQEIPPTQPLFLSQVTQMPFYHGLMFKSEEDGISGGISYAKYNWPAQLYGHLEGKNVDQYDRIELVQKSQSPSEKGAPIASAPLIPSKVGNLKHFKLSANQSLEGVDQLSLRLSRGSDHSSGLVEFKLPLKKPFERLVRPE